MEHHYGPSVATTAMTTPRAGTPDSDPIEIAPVRNPFASPYGSTPASAMGSSTGFQNPNAPRYFQSRRIKKGEQERPWLDRKDPKEKWVTIIPVIGIVIGLLLTGFLIYEGMTSITNFKTCTVLNDDFSGGLNTKVWTKEVELGGYG